MATNILSAQNSEYFECGILNQNNENNGISKTHYQCGTNANNFINNINNVTDNDRVFYGDMNNWIPDNSTAIRTSPVKTIRLAFHIFPNPVRHKAQLYFPNTQILKNLEKEVVLEVFDLQGRLVFEQELLDGKEDSFWELEVSDWRRGMYLLLLKVEGEVLETQRLVVE